MRGAKSRDSRLLRNEKHKQRKLTTPALSRDRPRLLRDGDRLFPGSYGPNTGLAKMIQETLHGTEPRRREARPKGVHPPPGTYPCHVHLRGEAICFLPARSGTIRARPVPLPERDSFHRADLREGRRHRVTLDVRQHLRTAKKGSNTTCNAWEPSREWPPCFPRHGFVLNTRMQCGKQMIVGTCGRCKCVDSNPTRSLAAYVRSTLDGNISSSLSSFMTLPNHNISHDC